MSTEAENAFKLEAGNWLLNVSKYNEADSFYVQEKSNVQAEAYAEIGYHVINVGLSDLRLGKHFLVDLARKYKLPFISANVVKKNGELQFQPYKIIEKKAFRIGVIGIIVNDRIANENSEIKPYSKALKKFLSELKAKVDFIILLADITRENIDSLAEAFPQINLIVYGGPYIGVRSEKQLYYCSTGVDGVSIIKFNFHKGGSGPFIDVTKRVKDIKFRKRMIENYNQYKESDYYKNSDWSDRIRTYKKELKEQRLALTNIPNYFGCQGIILNNSMPEDSIWSKKIETMNNR